LGGSRFSIAIAIAAEATPPPRNYRHRHRRYGRARPAPHERKPAAAAARHVKYLFASYELEVASLGDMTKGLFEMPYAFAQRKADCLADVRRRWQRGKGAPPAAGRAEALQNEVAAALRLEFAQYEKQRRAWAPKQFGSPFAPFAGNPECPARYEFWPANQATLPLLNFVATVVLGSFAAALENESTHSVAGYVTSKYRTRMTPANAETLKLSRALLPRLVKENAELKALQDQADVDGIVDSAAVDAILAALFN